MAANVPTESRRRGTVLYTWSAVIAADTASAIEAEAWAADRSVQIEGTFNGATVAIQGSNDGTTYQTLTDPQGNPISKASSLPIEQITEITRYIKPLISGGGGSQSLTIKIFGVIKKK
jgi:hypothetical protein